MSDGHRYEVLRAIRGAQRRHREERPVLHLQGRPPPVREGPLPPDGQILFAAEIPPPHRRHRTRRIQSSRGVRRPLRLSQGRHRPPAAPGVRGHVPDGHPGEVGRQVHRRDRRLQVQTGPREVQDRCDGLQEEREDRRRGAGAGALRTSRGYGGILHPEAQGSRGVGRRHRTIRSVREDGEDVHRQQQVREEPGEELLRHRHEGHGCRGIRVQERHPDLRDPEGVLRRDHGHGEEPPVRPNEMEHHRGGRHHREGPPQDDQMEPHDRRFPPIPMDGAGQQVGDPPDAVHLEVRAHRGLVSQHHLEPVRKDHRHHTRQRVLRRQDRVRPHRGMLLRLEDGGERASHRGGQDRRCGHHARSASRVHHARRGVERQGERPCGAEDGTYAL